VNPIGDDPDFVDLADAIGVLREQLFEAQEAAGDSEISFDVGKVEIEFTVEMRSTVGAQGGLKFWVVNADAKTETTQGRTHKVKLELIPTGEGGEPLRVARRSSVGPPSP
jgi:hypothetical protein